MTEDNDEKKHPGTEAEKNLLALRDRLMTIEKKAIRKAQASEIRETSEETCSFCGRDSNQVDKLLQAKSGATICNECIRSYMKEAGPE